MSCIIAFQISRTTPLAYWFYDKNLSDILNNGRVISFSSGGNILVDCEAKIESMILNKINATETRSFRNFLLRNNKDINDITYYYFTYDLNFGLIEPIEQEMPRLERQTRLDGDEPFTLDVSTISEAAISEDAETPIIRDEDDNDLDLEVWN